VLTFAQRFLHFVEARALLRRFKAKLRISHPRRCGAAVKRCPRGKIYWCPWLDREWIATATFVAGYRVGQNTSLRLNVSRSSIDAMCCKVCLLKWTRKLVKYRSRLDATRTWSSAQRASPVA